jgi:hypothetical protein
MRTNAPNPPIAGAVARVLVYSRTTNQVAITSHDYMASTMGITAADLTALIAQWIIKNQANYLGCLTPDTVVFQFLCSRLDSLAVQTQIFTLVGGSAGIIVGHPLPLQMGVTLTKYSSVKGQHGRGRITMPAIPASYVTPATDPDQINATGVTAYTALTVTLQAPITVGPITWTPCISTRPVPPANVVTNASVYTNMVVRTILGSARRRKEGVGI